MTRESQGVVVSFDRDRGFGFIRTADVDEDVFVHVSAIIGSRRLRAGQHVRFRVEPGDRGPRAVRVIPGSLGLLPLLTSAWGVLGLLVAGTIGLAMAGVPWPVGWLVLVNGATLVVWAWDKHRAVRHGRRVPEIFLLGLAAIGGTVGAWIGVGWLRHKRRKSSFVLTLAAITALQGVGALVQLLTFSQGPS
ncbi:cold shock and DUF1294 domain-containing protein [Tautonia sp. JC769]|uniref:cold shock and DUF1294 domain-containing protein n=1 Tax=Tautonia sp. JC769 TaxID=3232135 RepID=UPI003459D9FB